MYFCVGRRAEFYLLIDTLLPRTAFFILSEIMVSGVLQSIMLLKFPDKIKELLIEKTLQANQELDEESCVSVLDLGVRFVFLALSDVCKLFNS